MTDEVVAEFFHHVLDVEGFKLLWLLGSKNGRKRSFWFEDSANIAEQLETIRDSEYHAYFGVGSRRHDLGSFERGEREEYLEYRILWLDIDVLGANHKSDRLPPSNEAGLELINRMPLPASYVVNSGGGLQAYWLLTEAATADEMEAFLPAWAATWKAFGEERGWHVDNVFDLGRVMRAPGSINRKNDAPVEILASSPQHTYNLGDFEPYLREPEPVQISAPRDPSAPERPGDAYNRMHEGLVVQHAIKILEDYGFQAQRPKNNGEIPYVRPGKSTRDGSSATIYPDGHVTVYTSDPSLPTTAADKVGKPLDAFGLYTMFVHEGNWEKATETLRSEGYGDPISDDSWVLDDIDSSAPAPADQLAKALDLAAVEAADPATSTWQFHNLFDLADAEEEPPPEVGQRDDDVFLLYRRKVHTVYGEPGGMKSWFCQVVATQSVEMGEDVLILDFENSKRSIYDRFRSLGVSGDDLRRVIVATPDTPFGPAERKSIEELCAEHEFELIIVDGTTDAMVTFGLNPGESVDAAKFDKSFLKVLAATGAAVIYVDHVTKDKETRGSWGFGSQHKKSAIDGASFGVDMVSSFGKGMHGRAKIVIHKDKPGDLLQHALDGVHSTICELDMVSDPVSNMITAAIKAPSLENNPNFRPTGLMDRIAKYIAANAGHSKDVIITGAGLSGAKKDWVTLAFQKLETEGYIAPDLGDPRDKRWRTVKPYSEMEDYISHYGEPQEPSSPAQKESMDRLRKQLDRDFPGSGEDDRPPAPVQVHYEQVHPYDDSPEMAAQGLSADDLV